MVTNTSDLAKNVTALPPTADGAPAESVAEASVTETPAVAASVAEAPVAEAPDPQRRSLRRVWWLSFLAFFLLPAAWSISTPYNGAYDEHDHVVRAAGVVRGQILVPPAQEYRDGGYQQVPRSLVPPNFDCLGQVNNRASCLGTPSSDRTLTPVKTGAARYNPLYYAVVGWPLTPLPNMTGVVIARLVSALLCALFLASALVTIWPVRRFRLLMLAMLFSTTPILMALNGLVNPSGLEIDAAILLWAVLIRLVSKEAGPSGSTDARRLVALAVVSAAVLILGRAAGLGILVGLAVLATFAVGQRAALRDLLRRRDVRLGGVILAVASVLTIAWVVVSRITEIGVDAKTTEAPTGQVIRTIVVYHFDYWTQGTVGLFGYGTIGLPMWVLVAWGAMQGTLVLVGFGVAARRRHAYTILAIPVICFGLGLLIDMMMAHIVGYFMQGRYFLPIWVGMFFLAALAVPARLAPEVLIRRIYAVSFAIWAFSVLFALNLVLVHYKYGQPGSHPEQPKTWTPVLGMIAPYPVALAGIALMGWLVWRYLREQRVAT